MPEADHAPFAAGRYVLLGPGDPAPWFHQRSAGNPRYAALFRLLNDLPPPERFAGIELQAPVLYLSNVFEPEFWPADRAIRAGRRH